MFNLIKNDPYLGTNPYQCVFVPYSNILKPLLLYRRQILKSLHICRRNENIIMPEHTSQILEIGHTIYIQNTIEQKRY